MQPANSMAEVAERMEAARKAYADQFEIVHEAKGFRARHKITGLSYQAHDIAIEEARLKRREQTLKDSHHDKRFTETSRAFDG